MSASRLLSTYLNDHLAGAFLAVELARRAAGSNRETHCGETLSQIERELVEDRSTLQEIMRRLEVGPDRPKVALAWGLEKLGRAKLNGRLVGYSPLSRLEELEALSLGVQGKIMLWQALAERAKLDTRLADFDFDALIARGRAQFRRLQRHRLEAVPGALG